jgi:CRISPR-associated protein Csb1
LFTADYNQHSGHFVGPHSFCKKEEKSMDAATLTQMVAQDAALRRRQRLQPVGGKGDKIFPPTYPGEGRNPPPRHVFERRRLDGEDIWCVLVDSVQSQANRLEESLLGMIREGSACIPYVVVDFSEANLSGISKITSLEAPHRIYDAIFRDSLLEGQPFMKSAIGERLAKASNSDASALLEVSPTALLFGSWYSTGEGGGIGAKFARCLVSEIVATNVPVEELMDQKLGDPRNAGRRTGSRIDPLGVLRKVEVFKGESGWDVTEAGAGKKAKKVRPSEINHGNIPPSVQPLGVTCDYLEHMFVLSFAALRRLHFGSPEKDSAGRTLLAALGLLAATEQDAAGYALRSRCDLVCEGISPLELVHPDGTTAEMTLNRTEAHDLYAEAFKAAKNSGFELQESPLKLMPQPKLVEIVRKSQELALEGKGGDEQSESNGNEG